MTPAKSDKYKNITSSVSLAALLAPTGAPIVMLIVMLYSDVDAVYVKSVTLGR